MPFEEARAYSHFAARRRFNPVDAGHAARAEQLENLAPEAFRPLFGHHDLQSSEGAVGGVGSVR